MKTAISQFFRSLPRPLLVTTGFLGLGLLSTIMAALVPFERIGGTRDAEGGGELLDVAGDGVEDGRRGGLRREAQGQA